MSKQTSQPSPPIITTTRALEEFCALAHRDGLMAFDTEFIREESYTPRVCLVQAATRSASALIDPLDLDLAPFWNVLTDPEVEIVVNAGHQDFEICYLWAGKPPSRVFDVQIAAAFLGITYPLSYRRIVEEVLSVSLPLNETYTDWLRRPLTPNQLQYALEDVLYLIPLRDRFVSLLAEQGRLEWATEEMHFYEIDETYDVQTRAAEKYTKISGHRELTARQLAVLDQAVRWREQAAWGRNVPCRRLIRDDCLLEIGRRAPTTLRALHEMRGFPRHEVDSLGPELIAAVKKALSLPEEQCPLVVGRDDRLADEVEMMVDLVEAVARSHCSLRRLNHRILGTHRDFVELVRHLAGLDKPAAGLPALARGWRAQFLNGLLQSVLTGEGSIRVVGFPDAPRLEIGSAR